MFAAGAAIALRDLGLLQKTRLVQGVGVGCAVVAQMMHVLDRVAGSYFENTKVTLQRQERVSHTDLQMHQQQSMAWAWYTVCSADRLQQRRQQPLRSDPIVQDFFFPLLRQFGGVNHDRVLWRQCLSDLCSCTFASWMSTYSKVFHSSSVPWSFSALLPSAAAAAHVPPPSELDGSVLVPLFASDAEAETESQTGALFRRFAVNSKSSVRGNFDYDDDDEKRFCVDDDQAPHTLPLFAFSCRDAATNATVSYVTDTHAPQTAEHGQLHVRSLVTATDGDAPGLGRVLAECMLECGKWGLSATQPAKRNSCASSDPYGLRLSQSYFLRFRAKGAQAADAAERTDQCLLVIDARCRRSTVDERASADWCIPAMLQSVDAKHQTPRLYRAQMVDLTDLPPLQGSADQQNNMQSLARLITDDSDSRGRWTAEDMALLVQCANLGHALTHYRYGTPETRARFSSLLVDNVGDPFDIMPTLFPHAASSSLSHFRPPSPPPSPVRRVLTTRKRAEYMELEDL